MFFFLDSADVNAVAKWAHLIQGVTTNPTLLGKEALKQGRNYKEIIADICRLVKGPVSVEVSAQEADLMLKEADVLRNIAHNICIKVPLTEDGLKACSILSKDGAHVNVTLCFSLTQALLAFQAGATFLSPFVGRLEDYGHPDGTQFLSDLRAIVEQDHGIETQILAASLRTPEHVVKAALAGAHVATVPENLLEKMFTHPLTVQGLERFTQDWAASGQRIVEGT